MKTADLAMETTRYDSSLTQSYEELYQERSPFSWLLRILEEYAVSNLPRDPSAAVLDAACGIGSYCRRVSSLGYRRVTGVDISLSQIEACLARPVEISSGVSFQQLDIKDAAKDERFRGQFDVVNASWLFDTAKDDADLQAIARAVRECLKPGGRLFAMEVNFNVHASWPEELEEFGILLMEDKEPGYRPRNGERITAKIQVSASDLASFRKQSNLFVTEVTFFEEQTYKQVFLDAGFRKIEFHPPEKWNASLYCGELTDLRKFRRYVTLNPEMIAFSAVA